MFSRRLKAGYFALEGLNSFATTFYFYYFYFLMQKSFGFGNKANLTLAALNGAFYAAAAWLGGKAAQRFGYFTALKLGFGTMAVSLALGLFTASAPGQIAVMLLITIGTCLTWPALEALTSEGEGRAGIQHMVGVYNVVWAATAALANFTGGAMLQNLGMKSLFFVPLFLVATQLVLTFWLGHQASRFTQPERGLEFAKTDGTRNPKDGVSRLERNRGPRSGAPMGALPKPEVTADSLPQAPAEARTFLRMAWLANPFAYIAINTLIAVVPGIAGRMGLSTMLAGFCCSVWSFARLGAFSALWLWNGWHYRFNWLLAAFIAMVASFALILLVPNLAVLVLAQLSFGAAIGLIYYSSLFYSMDIGDTKGEHGGIHEAAIGLGNCAGPAVGAGALQFLPGSANSGAVAVTVLLLCGFVGLGAIWRSRSTAAQD